MSSSPLRPLAHPAQQRQSSTSSPSPLNQSAAEVSSASSSVTAQGPPASRADQVIYRFYVKTVAVLVEGRLTHYGKGDKKKDKWFNLTSIEVDLHKQDLLIYRSISSYTTPRPAAPDIQTIPPLLVAFILDTSDLPNGQALMWNRDGGKVTLDTGLLGGKGKAKEKDNRTGIILERWTLQAAPVVEQTSSSSMGPPTAYRLGIIHFRALYALVRLLPAYRLFRRLRRANNGLRLGIKLWGLEGFTNSAEDLAEAWEIMERGFISLDVGLDKLVPGESTSPDRIESYDVGPVDLFGVTYSLGVEFRPEIDFTVEDMESVLSEKFVDMDEDWFTPTVARHRMEDESARAAGGENKPSRRVSNPTAIPAATSPIPPRQQAAAPGSFGSVGLAGSRPSASRIASAASGPKGSFGSGRWGAFTEGMPFVNPSAASPGDQPKEPPSPGVGTPANPSGAAVTARRLSGHSIQQPLNMSSSPSTSLLRNTPPSAQPTPPYAVHRPGSSVGRTSSFLSQSGRSFTHAQLANMSPPVGSSPSVHSPISPSSLSFTKQPVIRTVSGRTTYVPTSSSSPIIPGSLDNDQLGSAGTNTTQGPQIIKRYSSSFSQRQARLAGSHSSGEGTSLPGSTSQPSQSLLRRTSTRTSQESNLRYSAASAPGPDDDDIQAFLRTLDALPQPPSLAAQAVHASRSHLPSTSSSLSTPSVPQSPYPLQGSGSSPGTGTGTGNGSGPANASPAPPARAPMTRTQVDDALKRMAGSFNANTTKLVDSTSMSRQPTPSTLSGSTSNPPSSVGLLTASRPASSPRRVASTDLDLSSRPPYRRQASLKTGSPLASSPAKVPLPESPTETASKAPAPVTHQTARSLPGKVSAPLAEDVPLPLRSAVPTSQAGTNALSPQTTGTSTATNESRTSGRRGPVLLRGGFEGRATKPSASSSPSHSPIRDFARLGLGNNGRTTSNSNGGGNGNGGGMTAGTLPNRQESMSLGFGNGNGRRSNGAAGQRTAPSSFGANQDIGGGQDEEGNGSINARRRGRVGRGSEGGCSPLDEDAKETLERPLADDW